MAAFFIGNKPLVAATLLLLTVLVAMDHISHNTVEARELSTGGYGVEAMKARHDKWMAKHGRTYGDEDEKARRFQVFKVNVDFIDRSNAAGGKKYHLGTNEFADMSSDEFAAMYTGFKPVPVGAKKVSGFKYENFTLSEAQQEVDWRKRGVVTDIKDQGQCGCCWAFSTVAAIEGLHKIKTGKLVSLSEQQLLDCNTNGNNGCNGGTMDTAFQYIIDNGGIATESSYPYSSEQSMCQSVQPAVKISSYQDVPSEDEAMLAAAVMNQPVSVGIDASNFQFYRGGIMTADNCGTNLDHAMTVVGYGTAADDGSQYWLLKNQWGKSWGEGGYMRLQRGAGACGVAMSASYPVA